MDENYKNKIISFYKAHKRMPGYQEIMKLVGFKSKNAVHKLLNRLVDAGLIDKDSQGKITPARSWNEVPLLGLVEAGIPTSVEPGTLDTISLDEYMIPNKGSVSTYVLRVKGDSMVEAGIYEGDLVIAERRGEPKDGDIVIAEVDGGWTMKYWKMGKKSPYLLPANKNYKPIYPEYELKVAAIVRGVLRRY